MKHFLVVVGFEFDQLLSVPEFPPLADEHSYDDEDRKDQNDERAADQYENDFGNLFLHRNAVMMRTLSTMENVFDIYVW